MNTQQAKAGQLDPSFNDGNPLYLEFPDFVHNQRGMAAGRDGLIYISGTKSVGWDGPATFFIGALDAQGRWNTSFGTNGLLDGSFFETSEVGVLVCSWADALHYEQGATAAEDRLYLLGRYIYKKDDGPTSTYPAVACFDNQGRLDKKFGTEGICIFGGLNDRPVPSFALPVPVTSSVSDGENREAQDSAPISWSARGGRFYIQGMARDSDLVLLVVIDFRGHIDWSFGADGDGVGKVEREHRFVTYDIFAGERGIYLSGATVKATNYLVSTSARVDYNGVLDTSYGLEGFKDIGPERQQHLISRLAQLSTEYFVAAGQVVMPDYYAPLLLSHDLNGNLNTDFNDGNPVIINSLDGYWLALVVEADAVIVVGRATGTGLLVGRFLHDGQLDTSFADGAGWRVVTEVSGYGYGRHVIVRPDRSIVIWGGDSGLSVVTALTGQ